MKSAHDLDNELAKVMGQLNALVAEIYKRKATASALNNSGSGSEFKLQIQLGWDFFINARSGLAILCTEEGLKTVNLLDFLQNMAMARSLCLVKK